MLIVNLTIFYQHVPVCDTIDILHRAGVRTYAMIVPVLPGAEELAGVIASMADYILIDRINYHYTDWIYRKYGMEDKLTEDFFHRTGRELVVAFEKSGIACRVVYWFLVSGFWFLVSGFKFPVSD